VKKPPAKERLLLIASAAGASHDVHLMGRSELVIGYWTGQYFRPTIAGHPLGTDLKVSHWAMLGLPKGIVLQYPSEFRDEVRE
jgi:hypothetical protein